MTTVHHFLPDLLVGRFCRHAGQAAIVLPTAPTRGYHSACLVGVGGRSRRLADLHGLIVTGSLFARIHSLPGILERIL